MLTFTPGDWTGADWAANLLCLLVVAGAFFTLTRPALRDSAMWRATVTPLASIIGSGFLVVAPLLGTRFGPYSLLAIALVCGLAHRVGGAVRYTIAEAEDPAPDDRTLIALGHLARILLAAAYVVAVAFYLELLGAFLLEVFGHQGIGQKIIATVLVAFIGLFGLLRGLHALEALEEFAVAAKLAVIAALLTALALYNARLAATGGWHLPALEHPIDIETIRTLMGAFLIVQGFETSRYLKGAYPAELRITSMRRAQWISAAIYLAFIALATVLIGGFEEVRETAILGVSAPAAPILPLLLVLGACMSQFSSAVADTISSGGLAEEETAGRLHRKRVYAITAALAVALIWSADIFAIIAWASRAFAAYYAVQCATAAIHATRAGRKPAAFRYWLLAAAMAAITLFAIPE